MSGASEWIVFEVGAEDIDLAKRMRAERDERYGNIFAEEETDMRWVGEIGEIFFDRWLTQNSVEHEWITEEAAGKEDFIAKGKSIGVKTVKRKGAPLPSYTAQITARHAEEPVDLFVFCCYDLNARRLYLLGAISRKAFLEKAQYHGPGSKVHDFYTVREGHAIYNIAFSWLGTMEAWLSR